jgi:hypothetical protein
MFWHLEIPVQSSPFSANGRVIWSTKEKSDYIIGVEFDIDTSAFSVRMVEQVCYIEHYRSTIQIIEGRNLTSEDAAMEWVGKFASDFPH